MLSRIPLRLLTRVDLRALAATIGALILLGFATAFPAVAQPPATPSSEASSAEGQTTTAEAGTAEEEITVVGDRLEESLSEDLSEYGSRLEKVSSEQVDEGGFVDVGQILGIVPGLYVSQQNGPFDYV